MEQTAKELLAYFEIQNNNAGKISNSKHSIRLKVNKQVALKEYYIPPVSRDRLLKHLDKVLDWDII